MAPAVRQSSLVYFPIVLFYYCYFIMLCFAIEATFGTGPVSWAELSLTFLSGLHMRFIPGFPGTALLYTGQEQPV